MHKSLGAGQILAMIEEEQAVPGQNLVNDRIDELRFQHGLVGEFWTDGDKFRSVKGALTEAYTVPQLARYIRIWETNQSLGEAVGKRRAHVASTQVISWSVWQPGSSNISKRIPDQTENPTQQPLKDMPRKEWLAERILRRCWSIGPLDESYVQGEQEVRLNDTQMNLLLSGDRGNFERTGILPQGSRRKVEFYKPHNIVRVTDTREGCRTALDLLYKELVNTKCLEVDSRIFLPVACQQRRKKSKLDRGLRDEDLKMVAGMTRTHIAYSTSQDKILIYAFALKDAEDARRMLLSLIDLPSRRTSSVILPALLSGKNMLVPVATSKALPHRHRSKRLGRWTSLASKLGSENQGQVSTAEGGGSPTKDPNDSTMERTTFVAYLEKTLENTSGLEMRVHNARDQDPNVTTDRPREGSYWEPQVLSTTRAIIGHSLQQIPYSADTSSTGPVSSQHSFPSPRSPSRDHTFRKADSVSSSHLSTDKGTFVATVPGLPALISRTIPPALGASTYRSSKSTLTVRLIPSPFTTKYGVGALTAFPEVHMQLFVGEDPARSRPELKTRAVIAVLEEHVVDIAIPEAPVDLRVTKREFLRCHLPLRDEEIYKFCEVIQASFNSDEPLVAPTDLRLKIPRWIVREEARAETGGVTSSTADDTALIQKKLAQRAKADEMEMQYLFAGFEHRELTRLDSIVDLSKLDSFSARHELTFQTVEAGKIGGRWSEIGLRLGSHEKTNYEKKVFNVTNRSRSVSVDRTNSTEGTQEMREEGTQSDFAMSEEEELDDEWGITELHETLSAKVRGRETARGDEEEVGGSKEVKTSRNEQDIQIHGASPPAVDTPAVVDDADSTSATEGDSQYTPLLERAADPQAQQEQEPNGTKSVLHASLALTELVRKACIQPLGSRLPVAVRSGVYTGTPAICKIKKRPHSEEGFTRGLDD
ncbi:hypothetical protein LTR04_003636 [Oleoguttula sp. CCFEE 6159]|nr:hypothetical protein LTR04_003636 [Oleoguttula sp. CCFEE 6159]